MAGAAGAAAGPWGYFGWAEPRIRGHWIATVATVVSWCGAAPSDEGIGTPRGWALPQLPQLAQLSWGSTRPWLPAAPAGCIGCVTMVAAYKLGAWG